MKLWQRIAARLRRERTGHLWGIEPLTWPQRMWLAVVFLMGIGYCYAFPPFQTNDEDGHWLRMWGVAFGNVACEGMGPDAALGLYEPLHAGDVRDDTTRWRGDYLRAARKYVGSDKMVRLEGSACRYQPLAYVPSALVARFVAFHGGLKPGAMLRSVFAARLANWVTVCLAVLLLCWLVPWTRNCALYMLSIPEFVQQSMAINTDAFLFIMTVVLLLLTFGVRAGPAALVGIGVVVGLMAATKLVYVPLAGLALIVLQRLLARYGVRLRDLAAATVAMVLPLACSMLWQHIVAIETPPTPPSAQPDVGTLHAMQQVTFLREHPGWIFTLMHSQWDDMFREDLMKGSWLSIFGAFGWSAFQMKRWAYYLLLLAGVSAVAADAIAARPERDPHPRTRWSVSVVIVAAASVFMTVIAILIGMYIYYSGAIWNRIGVPDVTGVQGRYVLIPIWLWLVMLTWCVRRRAAPGRWLAGLPAVLTTATLFMCVLANVAALWSVFDHFYRYVGAW